jgi:hypothetical protein
VPSALKVVTSTPAVSPVLLPTLAMTRPGVPVVAAPPTARYTHLVTSLLKITS